MKKLLVLVMLLYGSGLAQQYSVTATAYSMTGRLTATETRARNGIIAVSRDMLHLIPYGSSVIVVPKRGCGFRTGLLKVEDTMSASKYRTVDVHLPSRSAAYNWGKCSATIILVTRGKGR